MMCPWERGAFLPLPAMATMATTVKGYHLFCHYRVPHGVAFDAMHVSATRSRRG